MKNINEKEITAGIYQHLKERINEILIQEAVEAGKRTEARVREEVGSIVARVSNYFSYERYGADLKITVSFPPAKDNT